MSVSSVSPLQGATLLKKINISSILKEMYLMILTKKLDDFARSIRKVRHRCARYELVNKD